jgi:hypothetical protein
MARQQLEATDATRTDAARPRTHHMIALTQLEKVVAGDRSLEPPAPRRPGCVVRGGGEHKQLRRAARGGVRAMVPPTRRRLLEHLDHRLDAQVKRCLLPEVPRHEADAQGAVLVRGGPRAPRRAECGAAWAARKRRGGGGDGGDAVPLGDGGHDGGELARALELQVASDGEVLQDPRMAKQRRQEDVPRRLEVRPQLRLQCAQVLIPRSGKPPRRRRHLRVDDELALHHHGGIHHCLLLWLLLVPVPVPVPEARQCKQPSQRGRSGGRGGGGCLVPRRRSKHGRVVVAAAGTTTAAAAAAPEAGHAALDERLHEARPVAPVRTVRARVHPHEVGIVVVGIEACRPGERLL